ncbi:hypothetical protein PA257_2550 [Pseudomonas aeruginosa]|nr:hypothetical protein PA257_2550 [Pseudomonas aeruginosa]
MQRGARYKVRDLGYRALALSEKSYLVLVTEPVARRAAQYF